MAISDQELRDEWIKQTGRSGNNSLLDMFVSVPLSDRNQQAAPNKFSMPNVSNLTSYIPSMNSLSGFIPKEIPNVFGQRNPAYESLLGVPQSQALSRQSNIAGLLGAAAAIAQGMGSQGPRRSATQNILSALGAGYGAAGQAYQGGIEQMVNAQRFAQMKLQMEQNAQKQSAISEVLKLPEVANDKTMQAWVLNNTDKALEYFVKRRGIANFMAKENAPVTPQVIQPSAEQMAAYQQQINSIGQQNAAKEQEYLKTLGVGTNFIGNTPNVVASAIPKTADGVPATEAEIFPMYGSASSKDAFTPTSVAQDKNIQPSMTGAELFPVPVEKVTPNLATLEKSALPPPPVAKTAPKQTPTGHPLDAQIRDADLLVKYYQGEGNDPEQAVKYQTIAKNLKDSKKQDIISSNVSKSLGGINPALQPLADALITNAKEMSAAEIQSSIMEIRKKNADFKVGTEKELRNEFNSLPAIKEFSTVETSHRQINAALSNPSAANDLAAATKFMKLLDPGSVVRESELGMAMRATGAFEVVQNYFQKLQNGQVLNPAQRADFKKSAELMFKQASIAKDDLSNKYKNLANSYNVDPNNVVLSGSSSKKDQEPKQPIPQKNKDGWLLSVDKDGNRAYVSPDGLQFEEAK